MMQKQPQTRSQNIGDVDLQYLFYDGEGIGDAAAPELVPELVYFAFKAAVNHYYACAPVCG